MLELAVVGLTTGFGESVTESVTAAADGVFGSRQESPEEGHSLGTTGSGGRIRTYDQAVNSRPLYH
jgi:hypothetical protein